jgi:Cu-Zn family superoxide dismutase
MDNEFISFFEDSVLQIPAAFALIKGSNKYPSVQGTVLFYPIENGIIVTTEVYNLPYSYESCSSSFFGFHIHEGKSCSGNATDPFADSGSHYNPANCPHPNHSGDLPVLLGNQGFAWSTFFTNKFSISEITGKTIIIHRNPDDFMTQPSGNSGEKIACGVIHLFS